MKETLSRIYSQLGDIINGISDGEYASSPLVGYVNDSLANLSAYLFYVMSLSKE